MEKTAKELIDAQLKVRYSVEQYVKDVINRTEPPYDYPPYWAKVPEYTISRCPICLKPYTQAIDTYSLWLWSIRHGMESVDYSAIGYQRCEHFVGVHTFLNLSNEKPSNNELDSRLYSSEPEVPMVTPSLLPDDTEAYVVLHSLPLCRIEGGKFLPKYALYMLTYYSVDRTAILRCRRLEWTRGYELPITFGYSGHPRLGIYWEEANQKLKAWDLEYWIDKGKLQWLNLTKPDLPLSNNKAEFPYGKIDGVRHGYIYKDGRYEVVHTHPTIEEYIKELKKKHPELKF